LLNVTERLRKLASRNDAVKDIVARSDTAERPERVFAALPQEFALFGVLSHANFTRVVDATDFIDGGSLPFDGLMQAFDLEEQYRGGVGGKSGVNVFFNGAQRPAVHHFTGRGGNAASGDLSNRFGGVIDGVKDSEQSLDGFGFARELDGNLG